MGPYLDLLRREQDFRRTYVAQLIALGGDWFARRTDTDKRRDHLIRQLHDLGYGVALTKVA